MTIEWWIVAAAVWRFRIATTTCGAHFPRATEGEPDAMSEQPCLVTKSWRLSETDDLSETKIVGTVGLPAPCPGASACLLPEREIADRHRTIDRLAHVVDRE